MHARWLAEAGHDVELVDPMPGHVAAAERARRPRDWRSDRASRRRPRAHRAPTHAFDVVLLLGPLYHLTERDDRVLAWREALRV